MKTIKGPGIFLAQFAGDAAPFNTLEGMAKWAAGLGFTGIQIPSWDRRLFDLQRAAESQAYCDEILGIASARGRNHRAFHAFARAVGGQPSRHSTCFLRGFAPPEFAGDLKGRQAWAVQQLTWAAKASRNLGLNAHATFSGALAWPFFYPWPQRPAGLIDEAFANWRALAADSRLFDEAGVDVCYELHPGEDLHDGVTFERFLARSASIRAPTSSTTRATWSCSRWIISPSSTSITSASAPFTSRTPSIRPSGRSGVYGGYQDWIDRPGRFRSLGDGQIDFSQSSAKWRSTTIPAGRCWSGSAASSIRRPVRPRGRRLFASTLSV